VVGLSSQIGGDVGGPFALPLQRDQCEPPRFLKARGRPAGRHVNKKGMAQLMSLRRTAASNATVVEVLVHCNVLAWCASGPATMTAESSEHVRYSATTQLSSTFTRSPAWIGQQALVGM
jgi:hypothetical protein